MSIQLSHVSTVGSLAYLCAWLYTVSHCTLLAFTVFPPCMWHSLSSHHRLGRMYWAIPDVFDPQIKSANLDGTDVVIISTGVGRSSHPGNRYDQVIDSVWIISCVKLDTISCPYSVYVCTTWQMISSFSHNPAYNYKLIPTRWGTRCIQKSCTSTIAVQYQV